jgi:hypothetical protein
MFDIMLDKLGLPKARYNLQTHEDGEVSVIVTSYSSSDAGQSGGSPGC